MKKQTNNSEIIISNLKFYNYNFDLKRNILKINLPLLCYLKINFNNNSFKPTSHLRFGFTFLTVEWNLIIYGFAFLFFTLYYWKTINFGILVFFVLFLLVLFVCYLKTKSTKHLVYKWIENDLTK